MTGTQKRILVCSAQVPFVRGGAELLAEGLCQALRSAGHAVELVSLPYSWQPHQRLAESALAWRMLDLTEVNGQPIDMVICTKFPSYILRHPHKVVWLVHQHRQAYDLYGTVHSDFANTPEDRQTRATLFRIDTTTLAEAKGLYAISRNVQERLQRYNGLRSQVLHPPSHYMSQLKAGPYGDYLLSDARLDPSKRLDLLLHALAKTEQPIRCVMVSSGPDRNRLEALIGSLGLSQRVELRGYVPDAELIELYANARAVYYAPFDEDYGFTVVQAFAAARPLITTNDSGGVLEFAEHGVNSLIADPHATAIAVQLDSLFAQPERAAMLGAAGPARVAGITWARIVETLTAS